MTSVNSNFDLGQLKSLYSQLDSYTGGQLGSGNTYVNSIFGISNEIGNLATGNAQQKASSIQNLVEKVLDLIGNIASNESKTAKTEGDKTSKDVSTLNSKSQKLEENLEIKVSTATEELGTQSESLLKANEKLGETQEAIKEQEKEIQEKIKEIQAKQQELNSVTDTKDRVRILGEIQALAIEVQGFAQNIVAQSETVEELSSTVEDATNNITSTTEDLVGEIQVGSEKMAELTQDATNLGKTLSETSVRATENVTNKVALEAAAAASKTNVVTAIGSVEIEQKAKDQGLAATTRFQNIGVNTQKIAIGLQSLTNNANLLGEYTTTIKSSLDTFSSALGTWNTTAPAVITSLGTATVALEDTEALNQAISTDFTTLGDEATGSTNTNTNENNNSNNNNETKAEADIEIGFKNTENIATDMESKVELETPKVKYRAFGI